MSAPLATVLAPAHPDPTPAEGMPLIELRGEGRLPGEALIARQPGVIGPAPALAKRTRVADVIVQTLESLGVRTYYGIPGGSISSIYDALIDMPHARSIVGRHECGSAFMAAGHSRLTGELPALLVTSGPGIINALTGISSAFCDGVPMLVIGGEVPRKNFGKGAVQEGSRYTLDVLGMVRSVTKYCAEITNPRGAASIVRKAVATALSGRKGPVFLSLPLDVACEEIAAPEMNNGVRSTFAIDDALLEKAAALLSGSRRPVFYVGNGARDVRSAHLLQTLAHTLSCPVITTPKGKGVFPESDPLALGIFGIGGHPSAIRYLEGGVDVMLAVGAGFGDTGTNGWSPLLTPRSHMIQVDIDGAQIGKNYFADIGIVGPADLILEKLVTKVRRRAAIDIQTPTGLTRVEPEKMDDDQGALKPQRLMKALKETFPEDTVFTVDIGEHQMFALHYLTADRHDSFMLHSGLGAMGSGVCSAVGAKLARPERPVVAITGDCCFQMFEGELATAVQYQVGVVFAVLNDARPNMVVHGLKAVYGRGMPLSLPQVDLVKLAEAVGARGYRIEKAADLRAIPAEVLAGEHGPVMLDIRIDAEQKLMGSSRAAHLKQFTTEDRPAAQDLPLLKN